MSCRRSFVAPSNDFELKAADFNIGYSTSDNSNNAVRTMANEVRNYSVAKEKIGFAVSLCDRQRAKNEATTGNHIYTDKSVPQGDLVLLQEHSLLKSSSNSLAQNQHRATDFFIKREYLFYSRGRYKRRLLQIIFATFLLVFAVSCKDKTITKSPEAPSLNDTWWKMLALVDKENNTSRIPEEWEGNEEEYYKSNIYFLMFYNDSLSSGRAGVNYLGGKYHIDKNISNQWELFISIRATSEANDTPDGWLYIDILNKVQSFAIEKTEPEQLKLFYDDGKKYLLFEKRKPFWYMEEDDETE